MLKTSFVTELIASTQYSPRVMYKVEELPWWLIVADEVFGFFSADGEQLPDLSVFEDDFMNEQLQSALKAQGIKEEIKSPASCDSYSNLGYSQVGSPPYSPSISEASSQDYSTDEGFQSDFEGMWKLHILYFSLGLLLPDACVWFLFGIGVVI